MDDALGVTKPTFTLLMLKVRWISLIGSPADAESDVQVLCIHSMLKAHVSILFKVTFLCRCRKDFLFSRLCECQFKSRQRSSQGWMITGTSRGRERKYRAPYSDLNFLPDSQNGCFQRQTPRRNQPHKEQGKSENRFNEREGGVAFPPLRCVGDSCAPPWSVR